MNFAWILANCARMLKNFDWISGHVGEFCLDFGEFGRICLNFGEFCPDFGDVCPDFGEFGEFSPDCQIVPQNSTKLSLEANLFSKLRFRGHHRRSHPMGVYC